MFKYVYVSGPLSNGNTLPRSECMVNIENALGVGEQLIKAGFIPYIPHLSWFMEKALTYNKWIDFDLHWVDKCDVVLRMPGESKGADKEVEYANSKGKPVVSSVDELHLVNEPQFKRHKLSTLFHEVLRQLGTLHDRKQADYGTSDNPFANICASEEFGVAPWVGSIMRGNDKMARIKAFIRNGNLKNESLEDSFQDLAVYSIIAYVLYKHRKDQDESQTCREQNSDSEATARQILSGSYSQTRV